MMISFDRLRDDIAKRLNKPPAEISRAAIMAELEFDRLRQERLFEPRPLVPMWLQWIAALTFVGYLVWFVWLPLLAQQPTRPNCIGGSAEGLFLNCHPPQRPSRG
jgi:hypothetical protein